MSLKILFFRNRKVLNRSLILIVMILLNATSFAKCNNDLSREVTCGSGSASWCVCCPKGTKSSSCCEKNYPAGAYGNC